MVPEFRGPEWTRLAAAVLGRSLTLRRGQSVIIESWAHTLPLAEALASEARRRGIRPAIFYMPETSATEAGPRFSPADANAIPLAEVAAVGRSSGYIMLPPTPEEGRRRELMPPAHRRAFERRASEWNRVLQQHSVPCVWLLAATATASAARSYHIDIRKWRRESLEGSTLDPRFFQRSARPIARRLRRGRRLVITHPNGTHVELGLLGRSPVLEDGKVDAKDVAEGRFWTTIPSGWLSVALDERVADGFFRSNRASRHRRGLVHDLSWTFRHGRLHDHRAGSGRELFEGPYRAAGRERDRPAYFSIGLNPKIRDFPLAEDQGWGVVTLYVGHNDDYGGRTRGRYRDFALLEGATVLVDDAPIVEGGRPV
jgi:leucyl aminopeptidase (aminopeptidase T)